MSRVAIVAVIVIVSLLSVSCRSETPRVAQLPVTSAKPEPPAPDELLARALDGLGSHLTSQGRRLRLSRVHFLPGETTLDAADVSRLHAITSVLNKWPLVRVRVEGHTDDEGSTALNERLARDRAQAIRSALIAKGIAPSRLIVRAVGEARPMAENADWAGRFENRRVELIFSDVTGRFAEGTPQGDPRTLVRPTPGNDPLLGRARAPA